MSNKNIITSLIVIILFSIIVSATYKFTTPPNVVESANGTRYFGNTSINETDVITDNVSAKKVNGEYYVGNGGYLTISDAINASNGMGTIHLTSGNFSIGCINIHQSIIGEGRNTSRIVKDIGCVGTSGDMIRLVTGTYNGITIKKLTLDHTNQTFSGSFSNAIYWENVSNSVIDDVGIVNPNYWGIFLSSKSANEPYAENNFINNIHIDIINQGIASLTGLGGDAIGGGGIRNSVIQNIWINKTNASGTCVDLTNQDGNLYENIYCTMDKGKNAESAFYFDFGVTNSTFRNLKSVTKDHNDTQYGFFLGYDSRNNLLDNVHVDYSMLNGIDIRGTVGHNNSNITTINSDIHDYGGLDANRYGIFGQYANDIIILNTKVYNPATANNYGVIFRNSQNILMDGGAITGTNQKIYFDNTNSGYLVYKNVFNVNPFDFGIQSIAPVSFGFGDSYSNTTSGELFCKYGTQWQNTTGNTEVC